MVTYNQNPEQVARDKIDAQLSAAGWVVQDKSAMNLHEGAGQAVREYPTDTGPADYILFVAGKPVGVIEAKKETLGHKLIAAEDQTSGYAQAKLKWISKNDNLPFLYEATGTPDSRTYGFFKQNVVSEYTHEKAVAAMKAAVSSVVEDHRRRNRPLSTWRDGKVVYLDPHDRSIVREDAAPYGQDNKN